MIRAYRVELNLTEIQKQKVNQDIGNVRKIYNLMIDYNQKLYKESGVFCFGYDYSKIFNKEFYKEYPYIKLTSSKAIKQSIMNCDKALKDFLKKAGKGFPKFKNRHSKVGVYLPRNNPRDIEVDRHKVKVPTYGWLRLKEFGYLPYSDDNITYKSVTLKRENGRYFLSLLVEDTFEVVKPDYTSLTEGVGIDLGVKDFATLSDGTVIGNINKSEKVRRLERRLKYYQKVLSRKMKGSNRKFKTLKKKQKVERWIKNIRKGFYRNFVTLLVKTKPEFIAIEDLCIKTMLKNKGLADKISKSNFYNFRLFLENVCSREGISVRYVDRFYPSSKTCSSCGNVKSKLSLSERVYNCDLCGLSLDRDINAAINIKNFAN
jgi:putative transposase